MRSLLQITTGLQSIFILKKRHLSCLPTGRKTKDILSTYQSPDDVILMLIIDFEDDLDTEEITEAIVRIRANIKHEFKFIHYVIIQPE